jgi:hypothetical protein
MNNIILTNKEKKIGNVPDFIRKPFRISLFFSLLIILITLIMFMSLQPEIPIFYSLPKSSQQLADRVYIFLFPIISLMITTSHFSLLMLSKNMERRLKKMFAWSTVILQVVLFIIFLRIILIIT